MLATSYVIRKRTDPELPPPDAPGIKTRKKTDLESKVDKIKEIVAASLTDYLGHPLDVRVRNWFVSAEKGYATYLRKRTVSASASAAASAADVDLHKDDIIAHHHLPSVFLGLAMSPSYALYYLSENTQEVPVHLFVGCMKVNDCLYALELCKNCDVKKGVIFHYLSRPEENTFFEKYRADLEPIFASKRAVAPATPDTASWKLPADGSSSDTELLFDQEGNATTFCYGRVFQLLKIR